MQGFRVLIVATPDVAAHLQRAVEASDALSAAADTTDVAVAMGRAIQFDMVLLQADLVPTDIWEFARQVRVLPVRFVLIGKLSRSERRRAGKVGVPVILGDPRDANMLRKIVKSMRAVNKRTDG